MNFEDKLEFSKILEAIKANFNDKYKEYRKKWGGGIMGSKSQAKTKANERVLAKEAAERINYLCSLDKPMKDDKAAQLLGNVYGVLDLQLLLSASNDKTIRLWRIGCDQCLHIFHHKHYGNQ